jgi:hypothetical protein
LELVLHAARAPDFYLDTRSHGSEGGRASQDARPTRQRGEARRACRPASARRPKREVSVPGAGSRASAGWSPGRRLRWLARRARACRAASRGGTPDLATPTRSGPSPNRKRMLCGSSGIARKTRNFRRTAPRAPYRQARAVDGQNRRLSVEDVSKESVSIPPPRGDPRRSAPSESPRPPGRSPKPSVGLEPTTLPYHGARGRAIVLICRKFDDARSGCLGLDLPSSGHIWEAPWMIVGDSGLRASAGSWV